jgi:hypothetical protein
MQNDTEIAMPTSPVETASWVRERSLRVVRDLAGLITLMRTRTDIPDDAQSDLHFSLSSALANSLKLTSFAAGQHFSSDELLQMVGVIYERGLEGFEEIAVQLECVEDREPMSSAG